MANRIVLNETSYHGAGSIQVIKDEVLRRGFKKAFVCTDPDLIKFGVADKVTAVLDEAGLPYEIYSDIKANPTIENVQHGVAAYQASGADYIIAIGGGSSMDTAKAVGIIINNPEFLDVRSLEGVSPTKNPSVPIIAVPQDEYRQAAVDAVRQLSADINIPADLKEIVKEEDIQFLAESAVADACAPGNPKEASLEDIIGLYRSLI